MTHSNDQRRAAVTPDDQGLLDCLANEPGVFELLRSLYRGKLRWFNLYATVMSLVAFGVEIWMLVEMLNADDPVMAIRWGAGFVFFTIVVVMLKLWFWMRMNHFAALREIKRLELMLLANREHPGSS